MKKEKELLGFISNIKNEVTKSDIIHANKLGHYEKKFILEKLSELDFVKVFIMVSNKETLCRNGVYTSEYKPVSTGYYNKVLLYLLEAISASNLGINQIFIEEKRGQEISSLRSYIDKIKNDMSPQTQATRPSINRIDKFSVFIYRKDQKITFQLSDLIANAVYSAFVGDEKLKVNEIAYLELLSPLLYFKDLKKGPWYQGIKVIKYDDVRNRLYKDVVEFIDNIKGQRR